jgi:hypothetical protein
VTRFQKALFTVVLATVAALAAAGLSGGLYVHLETQSATQAWKQDAEAAHGGCMTAGATTDGSPRPPASTCSPRTG